MELQNYINDNDDYLKLLRKQNINVKINKSLNLALIKTNKNKNYENTPWIKYCRGAIVDLKENRVVCVPPMKSSNDTNDNAMIESYDENNIYQPLMDGTMINMFYYNNEWMMSTRSNIGATNSWEGKISFRDMFIEINGSEWFEQLDKTHCYSFVVQHNKNRIVTPVIINQIFMVESYNTTENNIVMNHTLPEIDGIINIISINKESLKDYNDNLYFSIKGFTIKNDTERLKWINPNYDYVLSLKMNYNDKFMNYLDSFKKGRIEEYLIYYPEDLKLYDEYSNDINNIITKTHNYYVNVNINKNMNLKDCPFPLIPLIKELHFNYLKTKVKNNFKVVSMYVINLPYKRLLFIKNRL